MNKPNSFAGLKDIFNPSFQERSFKTIFMKAGWKVYTEIKTTHVDSDRFQTVTASLYDSLYTFDDGDIRIGIEDLSELFDTPEEIALFLTDTFYIILNHYIRSLYGSVDGWGKIIEFTTAIQTFVSKVTSGIDDESFHLFDDMLINALEHMRLEQQSLTVLNTYLGIPIQYSASIVHTDDQSVTIKAHPLQQSAAKLQNGIYILKNDRFSHDVFAHVSPVSLKGENYLRLSRFDKLETSLFHRQNIRVMPSHAYGMSITHQSLTLRFQIFDLSLGGIALTSKLLYSIPINAVVILHFPEEIMGSETDIEGSLVYKSSFEGGHKYHFRIALSIQQESDLSRYIIQREKEIVKQLREETA